jgi:hypothetical protein
MHVRTRSQTHTTQACCALQLQFSGFPSFHQKSCSHNEIRDACLASLVPGLVSLTALQQLDLRLAPNLSTPGPSHSTPPLHTTHPRTMIRSCALNQPCYYYALARAHARAHTHTITHSLTTSHSAHPRRGNRISDEALEQARFALSCLPLS